MFQNINREKQVTLSMISNGNKHETSETSAMQANTGVQWHYVTVKKTISIIKNSNF